MRTTTGRLTGGLSTLLVAAYLVIGVFVASDHNYFTHVKDFTDVLSAVLGVVAWPLILAGVTIPGDRGAVGHSDADVVCHAVTDAILGAARLGDIGQHFPDTDARWKDASSVVLLTAIVALLFIGPVEPKPPDCQ